MEGMHDDDPASYPLGCLRRGGVRPDLHEVCGIGSGAQRTPRATAARGIDDGPFRDAEKRHQCSPSMAPTQLARNRSEPRCTCPRRKIMNKRWYFQSRKKLVTYWLGMAGYVANAFFRTLGLNSFDDDTSSSSCPWTQNRGKDAQTSLIPIRIPIGRRRYR